MLRFRAYIYNLFITLFLVTVIAVVNWRIQNTITLHFGYAVVFILALVSRDIRMLFGVFFGFLIAELVLGFTEYSLIHSALATIIYIFVSVTNISETRPTLQNVSLVILGSLIWIITLFLMEFLLNDNLIWFEVILNYSTVLAINSIVALIITPFVQYIKSRVPRSLEGS